MDKLFTWFKNPQNSLMVVITTFIITALATYNHNMNKLAELKYRDSVQKDQQELIDKYKDVENEITKRERDTIKWNEKIVDKVNKEIDKHAKDNNGSYSIVASDANDSL